MCIGVAFLVLEKLTWHSFADVALQLAFQLLKLRSYFLR